jgi:hypothetical protein
MLRCATELGALKISVSIPSGRVVKIGPLVRKVARMSDQCRTTKESAIGHRAGVNVSLAKQVRQNV